MMLNRVKKINKSTSKKKKEVKSARGKKIKKEGL